MITRTFKNNNITIRRDSFDCMPPADLAAFVEFLANAIDAPDLWEAQEDYYNWELTLCVNGAPRIYWINQDDVNDFCAGRTVRLRYMDDAPLFTLPTFYKDTEATRKDGTRGVIFTFCDPIPEDTAEAMRRAGCDLLVSQCQYAPEIKHSAAFVPFGVAFAYC